MRRDIALRQTFAAVGFLLAVLFLVAKCTGCALLGQGDGASDEELAYRAVLLRCVDNAKTLAESKACRRKADLEWLVQDGGAK